MGGAVLGCTHSTDNIMSLSDTVYEFDFFMT